jgi:hypothetical protein
MKKLKRLFQAKPQGKELKKHLLMKHLYQNMIYKNGVQNFGKQELQDLKIFGCYFVTLARKTLRLHKL